MAFRNIVMNGAMQIDQRNGGSAITVHNGDFLLDRWHFSGISPKVFQSRQNLNQVDTPAGFNKYLGIRVEQKKTLGVGDWFSIVQNIEAERNALTHFGSSLAKNLSLSFWIRSSVPGIHSGCLTNFPPSRSFPFAFSIETADTWEHKEISIPGDSTGSWLTHGSGCGMTLVFNLASMPPFTAPAGKWSNGNNICAEGAVSIAAINGATFYLTGIQLEISADPTPFEHLSVEEELRSCHRYFETIGDAPEQPIPGNTFSTGNNRILAHTPFQEPKRCAPTVRIEGGDFSFVTAEKRYPLTDLAVVGAGTSALILSGKCAGLPAGKEGTLLAQNQSRITLSAEL